MSNVYYDPEQFDLEILGSIDDAGRYEFNTLVVFSHKKTKDLYYAEDSGCSCPIPFESFEGIMSLTPIVKGESFNSFEKRVHSWNVEASKRLELINKVRELLNGEGNENA